ncbi:hypothetical protein ACWDBW_47445 [Streptomyces sp. NPDC001107]
MSTSPKSARRTVGSRPSSSARVMRDRELRALGEGAVLADLEILAPS